MNVSERWKKQMKDLGGVTHLADTFLPTLTSINEFPVLSSIRGSRSG